uniref:G-protein coupled receptors family 1 profile domain-containing protein n=1 Tax=Plectus sambesii TaxID=2011161 RepID=A0A914XEX6_9BILA
MVTIPLVATDMIVGSWIFGNVLCRVNYALESINKVLSTFILTAVSWDRCMAICCPFRSRMHQTRTALLIVIGCALIAGALITPIHRNATAGPPGGLNDTTVLKCHNNLAETEMRVFMVYIFVLGYCAPAVVMTVCYSCMLARIYGHQRNLRSQSAVPVKRVTLSAMLVVGFYYVVWTPYWVCMMWFMVIGKPPHLTGSAILVLYFIHALPYVNSSINWVFYAFLNKALRQSHSLSMEMRRQSQVSRCSENATVNKMPTTTARTSIEYELMPVADAGNAGNAVRNGNGFLSPHRPSC